MKVSAASTVTKAAVAYDFNGDGFADLAVGAQGEAIGRVVSGAVSILYGSRTGLIASGRLARPLAAGSARRPPPTHR